VSASTPNAVFLNIVRIEYLPIEAGEAPVELRERYMRVSSASKNDAES
jgi:hypothetical protein